jgi:hypothetical protein
MCAVATRRPARCFGSKRHAKPADCRAVMFRYDKKRAAYKAAPLPTAGLERDTRRHKLRRAFVAADRR